ALDRVVGRLLAAAGRVPDAAPVAVLARALLRAFQRLYRRDPEAEQVAGLLASFDALAPLEAPLALDEFAELLDVALAAPAEPGPGATPRQGLRGRAAPAPRAPVPARRHPRPRRAGLPGPAPPGPDPPRRGAGAPPRPAAGGPTGPLPRRPASGRGAARLSP